MSYPATVKWNSRERALSSDLNRQSALNRRALAEAMAALSTGTTRQSGCFGASYIVAPQAGTMKCSIAPGLALLYDATAVHPYSTMSWIEESALREVTLDAGDANPRYDVIEMRAGVTTTITSPRDEFNPLTGTFTVVNMAKEVASRPEFQVRKGTPAIVPSFPAGTAGWMPLAYIGVPGGAVTLLANNVVHCRPILDAQPGRGWTDPSLTRYATSVKGGGIAVANGGGATVANGVTGRFPGHHHDFRIEATCPVAFSSMLWDGGGAPAATGAMYFYACPPPFASGYDASMAPREFWTPDAGSIYGTSSGFFDADLQEGCIIIASTTAPSLDHPSGHPAAGNGTINNTLFSAAPTVLDRTKWVYLGSASYDHALVILGEQTVVGTEVSTVRKTGYNFFGDLPIGVDTAADLRTEITTNPVRWPVTAVHIEAQVISTIGAGGYLLTVATDEMSGSTPYGWHRPLLANTAAVQLIASANFHITANSSGEVTLKSGSVHVDATTAVIIGRSYEDYLLNMR